MTDIFSNKGHKSLNEIKEQQADIRLDAARQRQGPGRVVINGVSKKKRKDIASVVNV